MEAERFGLLVDWEWFLGREGRGGTGRGGGGRATGEGDMFPLRDGDEDAVFSIFLAAMWFSVVLERDCRSLRGGGTGEEVSPFIPPLISPLSRLFSREEVKGEWFSSEEGSSVRRADSSPSGL